MKRISDLLRKIEDEIVGACPDQYWHLLTFSVVGLIYILLHENFSIYNIDDAWVTSYSYSYAKFGSLEQRVFGSSFGEISFFGMLFIWIESHVLEFLGWTRSNAILISTFFVFAASIVWFNIARFYRLSTPGRFFVSFSILLWEPFLRIGSTARADAFVFFLVSSSLLLFLRGNLVFAALVAGIAFETHPIGIIGFAYILGHMISEVLRGKKSLKEQVAPCIRMTVGGLLALTFYLYLHGAYLSVFFESVSSARDSSHPLFVYFFETKYLRHLPEIPIFLVAIYALYRNDTKIFSSPVFVSLICTIMFMAILGRGNQFYVAFAFVWLAILLCQFFDSRNLLRLGYLAVSFLLIPQYLLVNHLNHGFDFDRYIGGLEAMVPQDDKPIIGESMEWFGFQERTFYSVRRLRTNPDFLEGLVAQHGAVYHLIPDDPLLGYYPNGTATHNDNIHQERIATTNTGGRNTTLYRLTTTAQKTDGQSP